MEIIHISQECLQFLQEHWVLLPLDTDLHKRFCTFMSLSCPPTEQLAPQCQLTPRHSQFPQIWHVMCCVFGRHMGPVFLVSHFLTPPTVYRFRSSSRHFTLTSLQTYIIVKSQHTLSTTSLQDPTN